MQKTKKSEKGKYFFTTLYLFFELPPPSAMTLAIKLKNHTWPKLGKVASLDHFQEHDLKESSSYFP